MSEEKKVKYDGHREEDDGSKRVAFRLPDRSVKWRVVMPADYPSNSVLTWIKDEGIEDYLTEKYYRDKQYDKDNNIKRGQGIRVHSFSFFYNSFDGDIEIYRARYGNHNYDWGMINDITSLFNVYDDKTINKIKETIEKVTEIKVKSIKFVKEDLSGGSINFGDIDQYKRDNKLNKILS